ncbi:hypothetical protein ACJX0J_016292, partial [Zea mays]
MMGMREPWHGSHFQCFHELYLDFLTSKQYISVYNAVFTPILSGQINALFASSWKQKIIWQTLNNSWDYLWQIYGLNFVVVESPAEQPYVDIAS